MQLWRICKRDRASTALDGEGAKRFPGRWNHKGVAVAYCATSLSLATLEVFVHVDPDEVPGDLVSSLVTVPDDLAARAHRIPIGKLPRGWRRYPGPAALQTLGSTWVTSGASALCFVPSAITPGEWNVLVNPAHPDTAKLTLAKPQPFTFDPRLWK